MPNQLLSLAHYRLEVYVRNAKRVHMTNLRLYCATMFQKVGDFKVLIYIRYIQNILNILYGRIERTINCFIVWHSECRGIILKLFNIIWTNQPTCSEEFNLKRDSLWLYTFEEYIPRCKTFIPPSQIQDPRILSNIQVCLIVANTSLIIYIISNGH